MVLQIQNRNVYRFSISNEKMLAIYSRSIRMQLTRHYETSEWQDVGMMVSFSNWPLDMPAPLPGCYIGKGAITARNISRNIFPGAQLSLYKKNMFAQPCLVTRVENCCITLRNTLLPLNTVPCQYKRDCGAQS
jgi:hypothetical protein